jgi:phospholipase C
VALRDTGGPVLAYTGWRLAACIITAALFGCAGDDASSPSSEVEDCAPPDETKAPKDVRGSDEDYDVQHEDRQAPNCEFGPGQLTSETIGEDAPRPPENLRVVVAMLENRSFDHYLSGIPNTDYRTADTNPNPAESEGFSSQMEARDYCLADVAHEWGGSHLTYNNGLLDAFVAINNPGGERALTYYTREDLPFPHWLAENFAVGDRYFSSVMGPTWPNRLFLFKGTSCGYTLGAFDGNAGIKVDCSDVGTNLLDELDARGLGHKLYDESQLSSITWFLGFDSLHAFSEFEQDALNDNLPEFSMVGASNGEVKKAIGVGVDQNDDHPVSDVRLGQTFMYRVVRALMANPATFARTVLFITYDEHGGFYDHVAPPRACEPTEPTARYDYAFDRYGFRVPFIVVSPFVKKAGYVGPHVTDHASITRFVEHVWGLGAMTKRDANAWPLLDYFDFTRSLPPVALPPEPTVTGGCAKP